MPTGQPSNVVEYLCSLVDCPSAEESDGHLLERFATRRDQSAFKALMRRHGPLVWAVCRRLLQEPHAAEDAFQATFLVLVKKAGSLRVQRSLANWLYGVAYRTAAKARTTAIRRQAHERRAPTMPTPDPVADLVWQDLRPVLDEELSRLPDKYRAPLVLCYLEGKTGEEAARLLGWTVGTLWGRMARGRELLSGRLARRGVTLSAGLLGTALAQNAVSAAGPPAALLAATARAGLLMVGGHALAAGVVSPQAASLVKAALHSQLLSKVKAVGAVLFLGMLVGIGAATGAISRPGAQPGPAPSEPVALARPQPAAAIQGLAPDPRIAPFLPEDRGLIWSAVGKDLRGLDLSRRNLPRAVLTSANLGGACLRDTNLTRASLVGANLRRADLRGATLVQASLQGADLTGANLDRADLSMALHDGDTRWPAGFVPEGRGVILCAIGKDLSGRDLSARNLTNAVLTNARLHQARLRNADLTRALLLGADLSGADLRGAVLVTASLQGADLRGADLAGADLTNALYDDTTRWPEGFDPAKGGATRAESTGTAPPPAPVAPARKPPAAPAQTALPSDNLMPSKKYIDSVNRALRSKTDLWGEQALALPDGPTYEAIAGHLNPIMHLFKWYSDSEIIYLPFGVQDTPTGGTDYALHYADGGQIVSRRSEVPPAPMPATAPPHAGKRTTIFVGPDGRERYGSALARLPLPTMGEGYLPILQTRYTDVAGIQYTQESFATRIPQTRSLVSFGKLTANRGKSRAANVKVRIHFDRVDREAKAIKDEAGLQLDSNRVAAGENVYFIGGTGATLSGADLTYSLDLSDGKDHTLYFIRLNEPAPALRLTTDENSYAAARKQVAQHWDKRLAAGTRISVPEPYAMHAMKNLLIQNLQMNWLYSIGNAYEVTFNAESHDSLQSLGLFGYLDEYKAGLKKFVASRESDAHNYEKGERLLHAADYYFLTRDRSLLDGAHKTYAAYVAAFSREMDKNSGLLRKEQGGTDISGSTLHYNTHHQSVAWRGWRDIAHAWTLLGRKELADAQKPRIAALKTALLKAVDKAQTVLPDGAVYIPNVLRESGDPGPFNPISDTKEGTYWLLVATDGFASGIHKADKNRALLKYIHSYGGTLLGMIRFNYLSTPVGKTAQYGLPGYETQGVDNAYLPPYIKMLADADEVDRLVLSFYGKLAHGMSRNTFLSGEGDTVGVNEDPKYFYGTPNRYYRTAYLPPSSTNNAGYLLALRYMLIRETQSDDGAPIGLLMAHATPRGWLADGKTISVDNAPTYFGSLKYTIESQLAKNRIEATIDVPARDPIHNLKLRLRTPGKRTIQSVKVNGKNHEAFDPADESIDLTGQNGTIKLEVRYEKN